MDDRTSVWSIGLGLGLSTCGGLLLAAVLRHLAWDWAWLAIGGSVIVMCWFGLPVAVWTAGASWRALVAVAAWRKSNKPAAPLPAAPAAQKAIVVRQITGIVNGKPRTPIDVLEPRPARWALWQAAAERFLEWYTRRRSLTRDALTGPGQAFRKPTDWVDFTDELARVGLADKTNGRRTILAQPIAVVRGRIERGEIEWSTDADPPTIEEPPPLPAGTAVVEHAAA